MGVRIADMRFGSHVLQQHLRYFLPALRAPTFGDLVQPKDMIAVRTAGIGHGKSSGLLPGDTIRHATPTQALSRSTLRTQQRNHPTRLTQRETSASQCHHPECESLTLCAVP